MKKLLMTICIVLLLLLVSSLALFLNRAAKNSHPSTNKNLTLLPLGEHPHQVDETAEKLNQELRKTDLRFDPLDTDSLNFDYLPSPLGQSEESTAKNSDPLQIQIKPTDQFYQNLKDNDFRLIQTLQAIDPKNPPAKVELQFNF